MCLCFRKIIEMSGSLSHTHTHVYTWVCTSMCAYKQTNKENNARNAIVGWRKLLLLLGCEWFAPEIYIMLMLWPRVMAYIWLFLHFIFIVHDSRQTWWISHLPYTNLGKGNGLAKHGLISLEASSYNSADCVLIFQIGEKLWVSFSVQRDY